MWPAWCVRCAARSLTRAQLLECLDKVYGRLRLIIAMLYRLTAAALPASACERHMRTLTRTFKVRLAASVVA